MEGCLYLPGELLIDILAKLPSKSLLICTSVYKSWYVLIASPHFINTHLENQNNLLKLLVYGGNKYSIHTDDEEFTKLAEFDSPFDAQTKIVNTCNGLVCLYAKNHTLYLWNPCIRNVFEIPPTEEVWDSVGFGFSSDTNDYKIVAITSCYKKSLARVYVLRTGLWKVIEGSEKFLDRCLILGHHSQVSLNEKIYWVGVDAYATRDHWVMIKLDMKKDEFSVLKTPPADGLPHIFEVTTFSSGCLALIHSTFNCNGVQLCIWVMNDDEGCWTKMFAPILPDDFLMKPLVFMQNSNALIMRCCREGLTKAIDMVSCDLKTLKTTDTGVSRVGRIYTHKFVQVCYCFRNLQSMMPDNECCQISISLE